MSAVLQGLLVAAAAVSSLNPHLSTDGASIAAVVPPYSASAPASPNQPVPMLLRHVGRNSAPRVLGYARATSCGDDWFNRIHITPRTLALGNLASTQVRSIEVWNAYLLPPLAQTLQTVASSSAEGITITAPGAVPMDFAPDQARTWEIAITPDGPPVLDATLTWQFAALPALSVRITGDRVNAWTWRPNWGDGITERDEWRTDILRSRAGNEQRVALRLAPRRSWEFGFIVTGDARKLAENALSGWAQRLWALPVWTDVTLLQSAALAGTQALALDATHRDFALGGLLLLRASALQYEVAEVSNLGAGSIALARPLLGTWSAGTRVYPLRSARLRSADGFANPSADVLTGRVAFDVEEACDWTAALPTMLYRGTPVYEIAPLWSAERALAFGTLTERVDPGIGVPYVLDAAGRTYAQWQHRVRLQTLADRSALRALTYALRGAQGRLWVPSWQADLALAATASAGNAALDVRAAGIGRFAAQPGRRDLRIAGAGAVTYARVTAVQDIGNGRERLLLDTPLATTLDPAAPPRISWMAPARLAADVIEYAHLTAHVGYVTLAWQAVADEL